MEKINVIPTASIRGMAKAPLEGGGEVKLPVGEVELPVPAPLEGGGEVSVVIVGS